MSQEMSQEPEFEGSRQCAVQDIAAAIADSEPSEPQVVEKSEQNDSTTGEQLIYVFMATLILRNNKKHFPLEFYRKCNNKYPHIEIYI